MRFILFVIYRIKSRKLPFKLTFKEFNYIYEDEKATKKLLKAVAYGVKVSDKRKARYKNDNQRTTTP